MFGFRVWWTFSGKSPTPLRANKGLLQVWQQIWLAQFLAKHLDIEFCTHTTVCFGQQVCGGVEGGCGEDAARRQVSGWLIAMAIGMSGLVIIVNTDSS